MDEKELIKYFKSLGLEVHTNTKARGHHGFFMKNRIDISKNVPKNRIIPTLLHEFAHYIHYNMDSTISLSGGNFQLLFQEENPLFEEELFKVTNFVDENSLCVKLYEHRDRIKQQIKYYEKIIKSEYPKFLRSKKFKEFDRYIRKSKAKYLLKYDRVKLIEGFFKQKVKIYSVASVEKDFPDMPRAFCAYIKLHSFQKKQSRVSTRINKLHKYYKKPTELFARFVEGLYLDKEWVCAIAPYSSKRFFELLDDGHYGNLKDIFDKL